MYSDQVVLMKKGNELFCCSPCHCCCCIAVERETRRMDVKGEKLLNVWQKELLFLFLFFYFFKIF